LAATLGGSTGDGLFDSVTVNGGGASEAITIGLFGGGILVGGTPAAVVIDHADSTDGLTVNGNGGDDTINASALTAGIIALNIDGGEGNDTIIGSQAPDRIFGGNGNDIVTGGRGDDVAFLCAGDDAFIWNPGDGDDIVEGQAGSDRLDFFGSNASENF